MAIKQVRAQINGTWYTLTWNTLTGKYEKTITAPGITSYNLPGGYYPVTVEATDDSGNTSTDTGGRLFVRETAAPVVTITSPTTGALLDHNQPVIRFSLRDGAEGSGVKLDTLAMSIDDGAAIGSTAPGMACAEVVDGYDCAYTPEVLGDGSHTIRVACADNDGNTSAAAVSTITIDTVPPTLDITAPAEGLKTNTDTVVISGVTDDATSKPVTITISVGGVDQGSVTVNDDGSFALAVPVADGDNTIIIRATDRAGKFTEITRIVSINRIAPTISNVAATPNPINTGESVLISVTVTDI